MLSLFLLKSLSSSIILSIAFLTSLFLESKSLLPIVLLLGKLALTFKFISLSLQPFFFLLGGSLLLRSLRSEHAPLSSLLLKTESFGLFFLLTLLLLSFKLLFAQFKLFFVTLGLETLRFFKLTLVHFGKLGSNHRLMLLFFFLEASLLLLQSLPTSCILSFVLESIGLIECSKLFLPVCLVSLGLQASLFFFFGESSACSLQLSHAVELFTLLDKSESLLFFCSLAASFLLRSFSLKSKTFRLSKFGSTFSLRLLLLFTLFFNFETKCFFLFFLLLDDSQVILIFIFVFSTSFLAICLFVIFSIDGSVVLVLATTALALGLTSHQFIIVFDLPRQHVSLLSVQLTHEVLLALVTLDSYLVDGRFDLGLSVYIVLEATNHVLSREFVLTVVLFDGVRGEGPRDHTPWIIFLVPPRAKFNHRLTATISKHIQKVVQLVIQEHVLISLDISQQVLHHDLTRVLVEEIVCRADIKLLALETFLLFVVPQILFHHVEFNASKDNQEE